MRATLKKVTHDEVSKESTNKVTLAAGRFIDIISSKSRDLGNKLYPN